LVIFHAGSLSVPFRKITELFQERYPEITVKAEASGSRDCARKVCDLKRQCDVLGSADYKVVSNLLMPEYVDFNIRFATNEMAIAYTDKSRLKERIDSSNWYEILLASGVTFGRADANRDPCGYRTLMVMQLAERYYEVVGLAEQLSQKDGAKYIRPKETDLLALLEAGEIDYLFIYRSVAEQHHLKTIILPDKVNLKCEQMRELYQNAVVEVTGKKPGEFITRSGEPMVYSVTIVKNAVNRKAAEAWVELLLSPEGQEIMATCGQGLISPAKADGFENLPENLRQYCN